jgi:hypothetical protein
MAIIMRIAAWIFPTATEVTQGPLSSVYDAHIKRTPKPRCAICTGFEDTTKMRAPSRGTCQGDLAADLLCCNTGATSGKKHMCFIMVLLCQGPKIAHNVVTLRKTECFL